MAHTLKEAVHVDLRHNGTDYSGDFGPGDVELPAPVADLLVASGLAIETSAPKKAGKSTTTDEGSEA